MTIHKPIVQKLDVHIPPKTHETVGAAAKSGVDVAGEPRTMAEEFPTLGNIVMGHANKPTSDPKKDGTDRTGPPLDGRQAFYQVGWASLLANTS